MAQKSVLRYIILGLLAQQDLAGCDIKKMFEGELGDFWHSNHSQIYPELRKMETYGLIEYHTVLVGKKLEKKVYTLTAAGEELVSDWLHKPLNPLLPTRDEFTMKLFLLNDRESPLVRKLFREEIARHEEKCLYLQNRWQLLFHNEAEQAQHYGHACILKHAIEREQDRLKWLKTEYASLTQ